MSCSAIGIGSVLKAQSTAFRIAAMNTAPALASFHLVVPKTEQSEKHSQLQFCLGVSCFARGALEDGRSNGLILHLRGWHLAKQTTTYPQQM